MSNEWKDYQHDLRAYFEHNFEAAINSIPDGWMKSFMPQLKDELFVALGAYADEIMFYQTKEKFGQLTMYWNFPDKDYYTDKDYEDIEELVPTIQNIIKKYVEISKNTCVMCGEAATYTTTWDWIAPFCDDCEVERFAF
jgi:hypothetical protein